MSDADLPVLVVLRGPRTDATPSGPELPAQLQALPAAMLQLARERWVGRNHLCLQALVATRPKLAQPVLTALFALLVPVLLTVVVQITTPEASLTRSWAWLPSLLGTVPVVIVGWRNLAWLRRVHRAGSPLSPYLFSVAAWVQAGESVQTAMDRSQPLLPYGAGLPERSGWTSPARLLESSSEETVALAPLAVLAGRTERSELAPETRELASAALFEQSEELDRMALKRWAIRAHVWGLLYYCVSAVAIVTAAVSLLLPVVVRS
ncbi:MAG: hypothetical protein HY815_22715 [Candidatus Riflebacteria bacterium]|nr:hypothetical protein [Candidatus Riflebacteria bacterium]